MSMSAIGMARRRPSCAAAIDSERTATPSPRWARSATASGALATSAISGASPRRAQAASSTARTPVPCGMQTSGCAVTSVSVHVSPRPVRGWPAGAAATSRSETIVNASSPSGVSPAAPMRATSSSPARTCSVSRSELSSVSEISIPGCAVPKAARASNSGVIVQPLTIPTSSRPRRTPETSSTAWRTAWAAPSTLRA